MESWPCRDDRLRCDRREAGPRCRPCRSPLRWVASSLSPCPLRLRLRPRPSRVGVLGPPLLLPPTGCPSENQSCEVAVQHNNALT